VMTLPESPMLPLGSGETVEVEREDNTGWEEWRQVSEFSNVGPEDNVFMSDPVAGEILFGPAIRSPNGEDTRYGATPPRGSHVRLSSYRYGGGPSGNVGRRTLTVLKSSIPYIASVTNRRGASGGVDPENIEEAKMRGPQALRTRHRAVTADDFEYLAREASPSVGRVHCIQPQEAGIDGGPPPGVVQILLVPALSLETQRLMPAQLSIPRELSDQVREYLDERRLLTTALVVTEPDYIWVSVEARVKVNRGADTNQVRLAIEAKLYQFIHPLYGGSNGNGWPFGRDLFVSELYSQIQSVAGVEYTDQLNIFPADPDREERGEATQVLMVPAASLLCSHTHTVTCS